MQLPSISVIGDTGMEMICKNRFEVKRTITPARTAVGSTELVNKRLGLIYHLGKRLTGFEVLSGRGRFMLFTCMAIPHRINTPASLLKMSWHLERRLSVRFLSLQLSATFDNALLTQLPQQQQGGYAVFGY